VCARAGIIIGTARANPGKPVQKPADMKDQAKTAKLRQVYDCLVDWASTRSSR